MKTKVIYTACHKGLPKGGITCTAAVSKPPPACLPPRPIWSLSCHSISTQGLFLAEKVSSSCLWVEKEVYWWPQFSPPWHLAEGGLGGGTVSYILVKQGVGTIVKNKTVFEFMKHFAMKLFIIWFISYILSIFWSQLKSLLQQKQDTLLSWTLHHVPTLWPDSW